MIASTFITAAPFNSPIHLKLSEERKAFPQPFEQAAHLCPDILPQALEYNDEHRLPEGRT